MKAEIPFYDLGALVRERRHDIDAALADVVESGLYVGGPQVASFEAAFADYLGVRHCVAVGNGLDAIRISLECAGIGPGDDVIVPGFTFYATWLAVLQVGARPVPVDVDEATASLDARGLENALTERTRAILPVHLYGIPADMAAIQSFSRRHELAVIEDVAQAHGAFTAGGSRAGALGDAAAFSFYPTKNLGALGDAGALVTDDESWARRARSRRSYGQGAEKYEHIDTGWNSRMDPIQARVLVSGLAHLDEDNAKRRRIAARYLDALSDVSSAVVGAEQTDSSVWHHFVVRAADRGRLREWLANQGVASDIHYPYAFDDIEVTRRCGPDRVEMPIAHSLSRSVTSLPIGAWMTEAQSERVTDVLRRVPRDLLSL